MSLRGWLLLGGILVVGLLLGFKIMAADPEIKATHHALSNAKSYRADVTVIAPSSVGIWVKVAVVCPDRMDVEEIGVHASHVMRIGNDWWTNQLWFPRWTKVPDPATLPNPCSFGFDQPVLFRNPLAKAIAIPAEFDRALRNHVSFSKGELRTIDNATCRNWTVENLYTVCIREGDHLPVEFVARDKSVTARFRDWNEDFEIDTPKDPVVQPRAHDND